MTISPDERSFWTNDGEFDDDAFEACIRQIQAENAVLAAEIRVLRADYEANWEDLRRLGEEVGAGYAKFLATQGKEDAS